MGSALVVLRLNLWSKIVVFCWIGEAPGTYGGFIYRQNRLLIVNFIDRIQFIVTNQNEKDTNKKCQKPCCPFNRYKFT